MSRLLFVLALTLAAGLAASAASAAGDPAAGKKTYDTLCFTCHGATGKGDGPIKNGAGAFGGNPSMAPWGHLAEKDIDDLIAYVRSLKK
jgi:mono/diheme cytochrome c family protein